MPEGRLMFVEVLERGGDVRLRVRILNFPFTIGRGYDNDLILDDPYVAAHHLSIERAEDGAVSAKDLASRNGLYLLDPPRQVQTVALDQDLRLRIGHTQLRFRDAAFAVEPELEARPSKQTLRRGLTFQLILIATALLLFANVYLATFDETQPVQMVATVLTLLLAAFAWAGTWSFFGKLATRHSNFYAHGINTLLGIAALSVIYEISGYLSFALSANTMESLSLVASAGVVGAMLYRHIRLVSRAPLRRVAATASLLAALLLGSVWLVDYSASLTYTSNFDYAPNLKAPAFRLVSPESPAKFLDEAGKLRKEIDRLREED
jgi:cation transport ATPase